MAAAIGLPFPALLGSWLFPCHHYSMLIQRLLLEVQVLDFQRTPPRGLAMCLILRSSVRVCSCKHWNVL